MIDEIERLCAEIDEQEVKYHRSSDAEKVYILAKINALKYKVACIAREILE